MSKSESKSGKKFTRNGPSRIKSKKAAALSKNFWQVISKLIIFWIKKIHTRTTIDVGT